MHIEKFGPLTFTEVVRVTGKPVHAALMPEGVFVWCEQFDGDKSNYKLELLLKHTGELYHGNYVKTVIDIDGKATHVVAF